MYSFQASNVHQALQYAIEHLLHVGVAEESRYGPVIAVPYPVCIEFTHPRERVLYSATRDANPFFHLMESLWMLDGDNAIEFPSYFNSAYGQFSDDGKTMWDAYGWRWRSFFGWDQLQAVINELKANPTSRRCVVSMWDPRGTDPEPGSSVMAGWDDFYVATHGGKAVPCNTHAYVDVRGGHLNLTVMNRSNDLIWGMLGANVVHMSFLAEYLASQIGVPLGVYRQFTANMHVYTAKFSRAQLETVATECAELLDGEPLPVAGPALELGFDKDLSLFMLWARKHIGHIAEGFSWPKQPKFQTAFFIDVAAPMFRAWNYRKEKLLDAALNEVALIQAPDWQRACREWIERRRKNPSGGTRESR